MNIDRKVNIESTVALLSIMAGAAIAAILSPKDSFFGGNFLHFWLPQAIVLLFISFFKPRRPATLTGVAIILAIYLALFGAWVSYIAKDSMAWLGYTFSVPGGAVGALIALKIVSRFNQLKPLAFGVVIATGTACGIILVMSIICNSIMFCPCK